MRLTSLTLIPALLLAAGCPQSTSPATTPIPDDTDALMRWVWSNYTAATDADLRAAVEKLHVAVNGATMTQSLGGTLGDIQSADLETVGMQEQDPSTATGLLLVSAYDCTVDHAEKITLHPHQDELYPGVYESYARTFESDVGAYRARTVATAVWRLETSGSLIGSRYTMQYGGGDRRLPPVEGSAIPGTILLNRSWMKEPADFDEDYQIEISWERAPGKLIHAWADWRQTRVGTFDNDTPTVLELILSSMEDWDAQTATLCREMRPE